MKRLVLLTLVLVSPMGCKKALDTTPGKDENPKVIPGGKGDLTGGGGAIQGPRKAVARTVNFNNLDQMHKIIFATIQEDPDARIPDANRIMQEIRQSGQLVAMINDEILILTNTSRPEGIIAYTKWPQRAGNHYVILASGVLDMDPAQLKQTLEAQGTVAKLEK